MNDHSHRGEYADDRHDHDIEYAKKHHLHYDLAGDAERAHSRITHLQEELGELRTELAEALERIRQLEQQTPQARQLQLEADQAAADLAESGYDQDEPEDEPGADRCEVTDDGRHWAGWYAGARCGACGLPAPRPGDTRSQP